MISPYWQELLDRRLGQGIITQDEYDVRIKELNANHQIKTKALCWENGYMAMSPLHNVYFITSEFSITFINCKDNTVSEIGKFNSLKDAQAVCQKHFQDAFDKIVNDCIV